MTVSLRVNPERFKWPIQTPQKKTALATVPLELCRLVLRNYPPTYTMQWERINSIPYEAPAGEFRRELLRQAGLWIEHELHERDKWHLVIHEADVLVWGPMRHYERQSPTDLKNLSSSGLVIGAAYQKDLCDFRLCGLFVPEYGHVLDPGPERPDWTQKVDGPVNTNPDDPSGGRVKLVTGRRGA